MITEISIENMGTVNKNYVRIKTDATTFYLYFSYKTLVGIEYTGHRATLQNYWSTTTSKILNELEMDKKKRLAQPEFDKEVEKMMALINQ